MYNAAFGVEVVEGQQNLRETCSKQFIGETMRGIAIQQISEGIPHRFLNKASMISSLPWYGKNVQGRPDVAVTRMGRIAFAEDLVYVIFILIHSFSGENLQSSICVMTDNESKVASQISKEHLLEIAG